MSGPVRKPRSAGQNLIIAISAMLALVAGYYLGNVASGKKPQLQTATVLPEPRTIKDFNLIDKNGGVFTLQNFEDKWNLIFFGYSHCPDICPTALQSMAEVNKQFDNQTRKQVQTVFISVDPQRDTPDHMKTFVEFFNPDFTAVTGDALQIKALAQQLGIQYKIHEADANGNYLVDHSSWLIIINPQGQFHGVISGSHYPSPDKIARDIEIIIDDY